MADRERIHYDGRVFMSQPVPGSVVDAGARADAGSVAIAGVARGRYHQQGDLVWAEFDGGTVREGRLVGVCAPDGTLRFAYCQVMRDGRVISGDCVSHPQRLPDGRIRLREEWRRHSPHQANGVSVIDEVPAGEELV